MAKWSKIEQDRYVTDNVRVTLDGINLVCVRGRMYTEYPNRNIVHGHTEKTEYFGPSVPMFTVAKDMFNKQWYVYYYNPELKTHVIVRELSFKTLRKAKRFVEERTEGYSYL